MKKIILSFFFIFFSNIANAEWEIAAKHKDENTVFLIDKNKIKKEGQNTYFWLLTNLKNKEENHNWRSMLTYLKLDCDMLRAKVLKNIVKSSQGGLGQTLEEYNPPEGEWLYATPNSNNDIVYRKVCNYS